MPLDTRIALSGQPLQVQFRDPIASYNQLAQLTSADTQNQLAQMQMQENRQMAPYRMQEAQTKAASSKLTYDRAVEAQGFIQKVMTEAAQRSDGKAPTDPFEAAKQMLMHPNPDVQTVGQHLLTSWQKVQEYEDEMGYRNRDKNAAAAGAAPAVPVNATTAPMVAPGEVAPFETSAQLIQTSKPYAEMSNAERIVFDTNRIGNPQFGQPKTTYTLEGQEVPFSNYVNANIANSAGAGERAAMAAMPNQLAQTVAPAVSAAPNVNAMAGKVAAKTADDVYAEIMAGDKKYGSSKSWGKERALLEKKYEALNKAPVMHVVDGNLVDPNGNVVFKSTPDMHFEKQVNADGTETILAIDKKKGTYTPVTQNGVAVAGVNPTIKAAQMRINAEANKPAAKGSFEQVLDLANLDPDARQKMIMAKLAHDTAPPSAAADSQFERTMTALGLSDDKKNALRRQLLIKETRIPASGEGAGGEKMPTGSIQVLDPTDPTGKKIILVTEARAIKEGLIPASGVPKEEKLKPIPAHINTAISTNDMSIKRIQEALDLIKKNPDAVGLKNLLPGQALDRMDPKGVAARSAISDIGSLVIHDRSGSAVSVGEMQRLGFIPTPTDRADNAKTKLEAMLKWAKLNQQGLSETYGEDQGYKSSPTFSGKSKAAPATVSNW
jgi:hypothetical protein